MKTSLEMRSKNLRTTLENVLKQVASDVVVGNPITENDQGSHRITVRRRIKLSVTLAFWKRHMRCIHRLLHGQT